MLNLDSISFFKSLGTSSFLAYLDSDFDGAAVSVTKASM